MEYGSIEREIHVDAAPEVVDRVGLVHVTPSGRERRYAVDAAQLARAVGQLSSRGSTCTLVNVAQHALWAYTSSGEVVISG